MTDIVIKQDEKEEKKLEETDIKDTLKSADEYQKLKESNDKLEAEYLRQQELKAKLAIGGKAEAGQPVKSQADIDEEEAKKNLSVYQ